MSLELRLSSLVSEAFLDSISKHTHIYTNTHIYTHTHIHIHMRTHMHIFVNTCTHNSSLYIQTSWLVFVFVFTFIYIHKFLFINFLPSLFIYYFSVYFYYFLLFLYQNGKLSRITASSHDFTLIVSVVVVVVVVVVE